MAAIFFGNLTLNTPVYPTIANKGATTTAEGSSGVLNAQKIKIKKLQRVAASSGGFNLEIQEADTSVAGGSYTTRMTIPVATAQTWDELELDLDFGHGFRINPSATDSNCRFILTYDVIVGH